MCIRDRGKTWEYRPAYHKTAYRGHERIIHIGPQAQEVLKPWLRMNLQEFLFQPAEAVEAHIQDRQANRKTPLSCGNKPGTNRKQEPKRKPGEYYKPLVYARAVARAIAKCNKARKKRGEAEIHWHPHQLRHNAATRLRKQFDIETARVVLGHKSAAITTIYAEADLERAANAMAKMG